jgi:hypothetical protein
VGEPGYSALWRPNAPTTRASTSQTRSRGAGFGTHDSLRWRAAGVTTLREARAWLVAGVNAVEVTAWQAVGIGFAEAAAWHEFGCSLAEARELRAKGPHRRRRRTRLEHLRDRAVRGGEARTGRSHGRGHDTRLVGGRYPSRRGRRVARCRPDSGGGRGSAGGRRHRRPGGGASCSSRRGRPRVGQTHCGFPAASVRANPVVRVRCKRHGEPMALGSELACAGSLAVAAEEAPPLDTSTWVGRCPECGAELELGYAGLVPVHPRDSAVGGSAGPRGGERQLDRPHERCR